MIVRGQIRKQARNGATNQPAMPLSHEQLACRTRFSLVGGPSIRAATSCPVSVRSSSTLLRR